MSYEYRIETICFDDPGQRQANVLAIANRLGREGWRLASLDVAPRLAVNERELPVLFERPVA